VQNIYNFYSSGEEVLRQHDGAPPSVASAIFNQGVLYGLLGVEPAGIYTWAWQEKMKGTCSGDWILGSSHGGWKFNSSYDTNSAHLPYPQANVLPNSQLQTNAFFDFVSSRFSADGALYGANASGYATANRNRILADAIPALTLPVGASHVQRLAPQNEDDRNFDMQALCENGWSSGRPARTVGAVAPGEWHHSDCRQMAYTFTYKLFDELVNNGNLK
jgi:hypothetical protein